MRESNFAFPAQNKACVCITSQLYDRRALDTTSALPLFNSLTHLSYLTSTSPRIREIMTMDGGLERLVRMLHEFCMCPPPPDNPSLFYGLSPPNARPPRLPPTLNPPSFDKHAAYRFSLAFQCVVNIGVRGSEPIRSRVVQAGTLEVVGCILEAWLANKGFAVGPSASASGMPRETREQRHARRQAQAEQRQRDDAAELATALQRQVQMDMGRRITDVESSGRIRRDTESPPSISPNATSSAAFGNSTSSSDNEIDTSNEVSAATTPARTDTPTGSVSVPASRDRSGTIIARPIWDQPPPAANRTRRASATSNSRPETETEDDGDGDVDMDRSIRAETSPLSRRAVGIVTDVPNDVDDDARIIINDSQTETVGVGTRGVGGVEDGLVSLEANDDFAMGAPPGAPGAIEEAPPIPATLPSPPAANRRRDAPDATPRAGVIPLPNINNTNPTVHTMSRTATIRARNADNTLPTTNAATAAAAANTSGRHHHHHHRDVDSGPYRDEDVLLSLQLLAYLSKYPHVRQAFYKTRPSFHPATLNLNGGKYGIGATGSSPNTPSSSTSTSIPTTSREKPKESLSSSSSNFLKAFGSKGKERAIPASSSSTASASSSSTANSTTTPSTTSTRQTNVFSLVERFTFRPSSTETETGNAPPKLPPEIQYWAGVIMRNACRKDDSRGGIRQCANMVCGRWEEYPREFAKCRRCRKAKYCGKECQSTAWSEGHRFWCSAKDGDDDKDPGSASNITPSSATISITAMGGDSGNVSVTAGGTITNRGDRERRSRTLGNVGFDGTPGTANTGGNNVAQAMREDAATTLRARRNIGQDTIPTRRPSDVQATERARLPREAYILSPAEEAQREAQRRFLASRALPGGLEELIGVVGPRPTAGLLARLTSGSGTSGTSESSATSSASDSGDASSASPPPDEMEVE